MILKIDSTKTGQVIVELAQEKVGKKDQLVETQKPGSQVLLPMIVKILKKNKIDFSDLSAIEVNPGPGSFTGTRVGVSIANALGFALNVPVLPARPAGGPAGRQVNNSPRSPRGEAGGEAGKKGKIVVPVYEKSKFDG